MAYENFAKTCISTKQRMTNIGQPEHIPMAQTCEIYCAAYINTHPWLAKMRCCQKSIFCSGEWAHYAKHLLQWRRVFLCVVLVWQDKCAVRWWCGVAIRVRYFAITMFTQFLLCMLCVWLGCLAFWISCSLSATCANENECTAVRNILGWLLAQGCYSAQRKSGFSLSSKFETWQKQAVYPRAAVSFNLIIITIYSLMHRVKMQQAY